MSSMNVSSSSDSNLDIAIVGMAGRFPGARNLDEFWSNLIKGVESISWCSKEEVIESGFHPDLAHDPDFVPAAGKLDGEYMFDADFFGFAPREAEIMDPQQRLLLECAWEALEAAGYNPESYPGRIGVYAGASTNTYFPFHIASNQQLLSSIGLLQAITANDKDFLASRIAYKLNLKGPAISVQTACSTSLVAVNLACLSLLNYQCDMVLAGGVSVTPKGRLYKDGFIFSRDGHCRPFDKEAEGAVFGNGAGVVVLKRLKDALEDHDHIHAIIKSSSVNNDGSCKVGYTAPSVTGQMEAILEAQALADVEPEMIKYVEAHGTGTALGDPIEIAALTNAFRVRTDKASYCAVGSVKGNIGHLDAAAGISGLIKTALVLEHKQIPPTLHFREPNPQLNLETSPFYVNAELRDWPADEVPRRAAVSSFGFGGTNAHAILEQAPESQPCDSEPDLCLVPISARTENSLRAASLRLAEFSQAHPDTNLADIAFTLQLGRKHFKQRAFAVVKKSGDLAIILKNQDAKSFMVGTSPEQSPSVIFSFPGQGSQFVGMGRDLYESEPLFRGVMSQCAQLASQYLDRDLIDLIYPHSDQAAECDDLLTRTQYAQPALFAVEYALVRLWQSWGIQPAAMMGHSLGEYVAACIAGVFSLEDAIKLICARADAMQEQPAGAMMGVPMSETEVRGLLPGNLALAAVNAPSLCVVSGPAEAMADFQALLAERGIRGRLLHVSHAFHSPMMEPAGIRFSQAFHGVKLSPPQIPFVSNVTGDWATASLVCDPEYWIDHLLSTVRFSDGWQRLNQDQHSILLEVGAGHALTTLARQFDKTLRAFTAISSLGRARDANAGLAHILTSLGTLWLHGIKVEWNALHHGRTRRRVPLPTYQFQRKQYLLPPAHGTSVAASDCVSSKQDDLQVPALNQSTIASRQPSLQHDELENVITGIWQEVLGVQEIGPEDDFFVLGGHSLMAIQLIAEIRRLTGTEVSIKSLFEQPTVSALAKKIRESKSAFAVDEGLVIERIPRNGDLPLTFHQADVWKFETEMPGTARYAGVIGLSLSGPLVHAGLEFAINEILSRHEVLRTAYSVGANGQPVALVQPPQHLSMPVNDISWLDPESRQKEILQSANKLVRTPFDFSHDLFFRPLLFKTGAIEHVLLICSHYIAVDGWTVGLILNEFGEHYAAHVEARSPRVPEVNIQCIDYAHWQRSHVSEESLASNLSYWHRRLLDVAPQEPLPLDHPRSKNFTMSGSTLHFALTPDLTRSLKRFSHQHGSTLFFTLISALNVLLHTQSGSQDIVIGTITGDREAGMETVFGSFVNCLPLRNHLDPRQTFLEVMDTARSSTTDAYAHQVPFYEIAGTLRQDRDLINNPLFGVMLVLRNIPFTEMKTGGLEIRLSPLQTNRAVSEVDISLYLQEMDENLSGYFEYNHQIFDRCTIERLSGNFVELLEEITANSHLRLCDFTKSREIVRHVA